MMKRAAFSLSALLVLFLLSGMMLAQDATAEPGIEVTETPIGDLNYNSPVIGHIGGDNTEQVWPLLTASADKLTVVVERADGNFVPSVAILDPNGVEVTNSYGPGYDGAKATIANFVLPSGGSYQIRVSPYAEGTAGHYELTVIPVATAADNINNTTVIGAAEADTAIEGEITATHWYQQYAFEATSPDTLDIMVERTGGNLMPEVEILDPNGTALITGYNARPGDQAVIDNFTLPGPGQYVIAVTRNYRFDGATEGAYRLTIETVGSGQGNPNLAGSAGDVEYDTTLQGELTNRRWYVDWALQAQAGDTLRITAARTGGNLQPEVALIGGAGQELTHGYVTNTGDFATFDYTLEAPGAYIVRVLRTDGQLGQTTGTYDLTVQVLGSGEGSPNLTEATGAIEVGQTVDGEVTNRRWADTWTLNGQPNQIILVTVTRTDGTLIPMVDVRDSNGQTLTTGYPESTRDRTSTQYTLPAAGTYEIVVYRESGQSGVSQGAYELSVTQGG
jgi:hypothetical protein